MKNSDRYLCFNLGKEEYAIPLLSIKEVIGLPDVTPVPQTATYFLGIMNLRGQVISVIDLRSKLNIKPMHSEETSVIILDLSEHQMGVVVDKVNSVHMLNEVDISPRPNLDSSKSIDYVCGVFRKEERLVLLLDIIKALSLEDRQQIKNINLKKAI